MIIEVALGVIIGVVLLAYWREIMVLGALGFALVITSIFLVFFGIFLYAALLDMRQAPLWHAASSAVTWAVGLLVNALFASAIGQVLEGRTSLRGREAFVLGAFFQILTLATVWLVTDTAFSYFETKNVRALLTMPAVAAAWWVLVSVTLRRNNRARHRSSSAV